MRAGTRCEHRPPGSAKRSVSSEQPLDAAPARRGRLARSPLRQGDDHDDERRAAGDRLRPCPPHRCDRVEGRTRGAWVAPAQSHGRACASLRSYGAATDLLAWRDSTGHQKVIGNGRQLFRDVPIPWKPSDEEPPHQSEVSQRDPRCEVDRDRPPILSRGRRFKSCPRY